MNSKKYFLLAFVIVAIVQLYIPAKMILNREEVLESGREFKFKTAPIDPYDIFRGKYIHLRYAENVLAVNNETDWQINERIYVVFSQDSEGFAKVQSVSKEMPAESQFFFKSKVAYMTSDSSNLLTIEYPFSRYYMEESKAYDAEQLYRKSLSDSNSVTYALVFIKLGESVLKDVLVDSISIREIVKNNY